MTCLSPRLAAPALVLAGALMMPAPPAAACSNHPSTCAYHLQQHNQNMEVARQNAEAYASSREEARQRRREARHAAEQAPDPTQRRLNAVVALVHVAQSMIDDLAKDPRFQALRKGQWHVFEDGDGRKPGEFCAALFINLKGFVRVSGPGADYQGALLTFWGPEVPAPDQLRTIPVALTQSDDGQTQTVQAFNYTDTALSRPMGVIAFAVPTAEALLSNMKDKLGFQLAVEGARVLDISWHSGLATRDKLRRCLAQRGRS